MPNIFTSSSIALLAFVISLISCNSPVPELQKQKKPQTTERSYEDLRMEALHTTSDHMHFNTNEDTPIVYGLVADHNTNGLITTQIVFKTGETKMLTQMGINFQDTGKDVATRHRTRIFFEHAQQWLKTASIADPRSLPDKNWERFSFLTQKGIFSVLAKRSENASGMFADIDHELTLLSLKTDSTDPE
jgi:hypothetical protein